LIAVKITCCCDYW